MCFYDKGGNTSKTNVIQCLQAVKESHILGGLATLGLVCKSRPRVVGEWHRQLEWSDINHITT